MADRDPGTVLHLLNKAVMHDHDADNDRFLTAAFASISADRDGISMRVAVGGHPPPLLLRADGAVEQVDAAGLLIGVTHQVEYPEQRLVLGSGDRLVLYTDGLTDAQAPRIILTQTDLAAILGAVASSAPSSSRRSERRARHGIGPA